MNRHLGWRSSQNCRSLPLFSFPVMSDSGVVTWRRLAPGDFPVYRDSSMAQRPGSIGTSKILPLNFRGKCEIYREY